MTEIPTVVHVAGVPVDGKQRRLDCGFLLGDWSSNSAQEWPRPWPRGHRVGVRIDESHRDGFVVAYFDVGSRELEPDERRCAER